MNHKQFEELILNSEPLTPSEEDLLKTHLLSCQRCKALKGAWKFVEQDFKSLPMVSPPPEFVANWEKYQISATEKRAKRNSIALAGSILAVSSTATSVLYLTSLSNFSIFEFLSSFFTKFGYLIAQLTHTIRGFSSLSKTFPLFMPISTGIGLSVILMTIILFVFWIISMLRILLPKQGVV